MPKLTFICILRVVAYFLSMKYIQGREVQCTETLLLAAGIVKIVSLFSGDQMSCQSIKSVFREFPLVKIKQMV